MRFFPKSADFFVFFENMAQNIVDAARHLNEIMVEPARVTELAEKIKALEHQADETVHAAMNQLDTVFITPFDREDIHELVSRLDDIIDHVDGAAKHMVLYEITCVPEGMKPLAALLEKAAMAVHTAVFKFKDLKRTRDTIAAVIEINRIEDEGDAAMRAGMARLFKNGLDPIEIIKMKDIYEDVENAIDRCEDVANVIEGVILKNA
jgi:hypothetical protein